jgi:hypothetical protein
MAQLSSEVFPVEGSPHDLSDLLRSFIKQWELGDTRSAVVYVKINKGNKEKVQIRFSWQSLKIELCTTALKQYKVLLSDPVYRIMDALKTIVSISGHGQITINPRNNAKPKRGSMGLEIVYIATSHIDVKLDFV